MTDKKDGTKEVDRLQQAIEDRVSKVTLSDKRVLEVHKWTWRKGLTLSARMLEALKSWAFNGKLEPKDIMSMPIKKIVEDHSDTVAEVLAETLEPGNFKTREEAAQFVEDMLYEDFIKVTEVVIQQNFVPLRHVFSKLTSIVKSGGKLTR